MAKPWDVGKVSLRDKWNRFKEGFKDKMDDAGQSLKDGYNDNGGASGLGLTALKEAPKVVGALTTDISEAETSQQAGSMADGATMQLASSGGQIGMMAGGPLGAVAGTVLGLGIGQIKKVGGQKNFYDVQDEKSKKEWLQEEEDRLRSWYDQNDSEAIAARIELGKRQNGLIG